MAPAVDWKNLGFEYLPTDGFVAAEYHNGAWGPLETRTEPTVSMHIGATCLHYGQACFEGLKAFTQKNGRVAIFRPRDNGARLASSARRIAMVPAPEELFLNACTMAVKLNRAWVPPYGTGASLYVRPLLLGTTPRVGLKPADDYLLIVLVTPVGPYYKGGCYPVKALLQEAYDRAAPRGVGNVKVAGNYAAGLLGGIDAKKKGFAVDLYLDSAQRMFVDEFGTSNFIGITREGHFITPESPSVLPSITNLSLQQIAKDLGMKVEKRKIPLAELEELREVGACGTAAVITPIYSITYRDRVYTFGEEKKAGATLTKLYERLQGIQYGDLEDRHGWMLPVP